MKVHYSEGIANHAGPESCAGSREATSEALTGECVGQPLSGVIAFIRGADAFETAEGNTSRVAIARPGPALRRLRTWHAWKLSAREPGDLHILLRSPDRRRNREGGGRSR